jgi:hypothetical protein
MRGWILTWMDIHGMPIFSRSDSFLIILAEKVKQCRTIAGKRESLATHFFWLHVWKKYRVNASFSF